MSACKCLGSVTDIPCICDCAPPPPPENAPMPGNEARTLRERAIAACEEQPFVDDAHLAGTTQQGLRAVHYVDQVLALLTRDEAMVERVAAELERQLAERGYRVTTSTMRISLRRALAEFPPDRPESARRSIYRAQARTF